MASKNQDSGNGLKLLLAWGFVGIPLTWGVINTIINAMKLFQ
ncbi:MAG: oxalate:formate antiporter [Alphaproteobacteria bacterium]|nr:oxalate:formate antiporter [Alphaproteobacteria bacterium]